MNWHNISDPPDNCRTVLCLMADGAKHIGWYGPKSRQWCPRDENWHGCDDDEFHKFEPVGWQELEASDEQEWR